MKKIIAVFAVMFALFGIASQSATAAGQKVSGTFNSYTDLKSAFPSNATVDMHCYNIGHTGVPVSAIYYKCFIEKRYDPDQPPYPNVGPTVWYDTYFYDQFTTTQRGVDAAVAAGWICRNMGIVGVNVQFQCVRLHV